MLPLCHGGGWGGRLGQWFLGGSLLIVVCLGLAAWNTGEMPAEMFSWGSFERQQKSLSTSVAGVLGSREGVAELERNGRNVVEQLHELKDMVNPRRRGRSGRHGGGGIDAARGGVGFTPGGRPRRTVPMNEELAMLKVHKQMMSEERFPKDKISGAGDVTGIVNEGDQRMEDSALMQVPAGKNTKVSTLYENCEDSSLTAEDGELCRRRANAIRQLTEAAVASQLAQAPPRSPNEQARETVEDSARQELAADAMVGKEYLEGRLGEGSTVSAGGVGMRRAYIARVRRSLSAAKKKLAFLRQSTPFTYMSDSARRQQLVNTYADYLPSGKKVVCTCDSKMAGDEEMEGLTTSSKPACKCVGGVLAKSTQTETGGPLDTGSADAWPQGLLPTHGKSRIDGYGQYAYKARSQKLSATSAMPERHPVLTEKVLASLAKSKTPSSLPVLESHTVFDAGTLAAKHAVNKAAVHPRRPAVVSLKSTVPVESKTVAIKASSQATPAHDSMKATSFQTSKTSEVKASVAARSESKSDVEKHVSQISLLKKAVDAAGTPKTSHRSKLTDLEKSISDAEHLLSQRKRAFRQELEHRQLSLMSDFSEEMREIQDGIQLTTGETVPLSNVDSGGVAELGAARSAVMQGENPIVAATRATDFGKGLIAQSPYEGVRQPAAVSQQTRGQGAYYSREQQIAVPQQDQIVKEIMQHVKQSRLFQHPPRPTHTEEPPALREKDVLKRAIDQQFNQVASLGQGDGTQSAFYDHALVDGTVSAADGMQRQDESAIGVQKQSHKLVRQGLKMVSGGGGIQKSDHCESLEAFSFCLLLSFDCCVLAWKDSICSQKKLLE